jgi:hypothetical protein
MDLKTLFLTLTLLPAVIFFACQQPESKVDQLSLEMTAQDSLYAAQYNILYYFSEDAADTILVNAVTFIGRKPPLATSETRFNPEFREYYIEYSGSFSFFLYHIGNDSTHYFYMIRPARSIEGNRRGVIGKFRMDDDMSLFEFEEFANTRIKSEQELKKTGITLFRELLENGNIRKHLPDTAIIEWPDSRLKYDKIKNEWRYDVIDEKE